MGGLVSFWAQVDWTGLWSWFVMGLVLVKGGSGLVLA